MRPIPVPWGGVFWHVLIKKAWRSEHARKREVMQGVINEVIGRNFLKVVYKTGKGE